METAFFVKGMKYLPVGKNDVFHYVQNDVARCTRNDVMFAQSTREATSLGEADIIDEVNIICRRQTSLKKALLSKCFFW